MPPVIKAQKLDAANRLDITFAERTAGRLHDPVQFGRVQARRQRLAADHRPRRCARRQSEVPVQPVRLLGRRRDLAGQREDAEGSGRQGARRRALVDQLRDVRVPGQEAGRRHLEDQGGQHRASGPRQLCDRRPRRRRPALGAGLHAADGQEARHPHARPEWPRPGRRSPAAAAFPISASRRMPTGPSRTRSSFSGSTPPTSRPAEWIQKNPDEAAKIIAPKATPEDLDGARHPDPGQ